MTHNEYHYHHHDNSHKTKRCSHSDGFFMRTIKGLAKRFNVSNKVIIIGFIIFFLITKFFAIVAFIVAYHWVKHPGKVEDIVDSVIEKGRRGFERSTRKTDFDDTIYAGGYDGSHERDNFNFSDLKRKFDDLEKRTNGMEEHVSSEEHKLNQEFETLKSEK